MMTYKIVKNAMVTVLGDQAEERFRVIGYQRQNKDAEDVQSNNCLVQVYFESGEFPKSGAMRGDKKHNITLNIDLTASAKAEGDIDALLSGSTTEKALALLNVKEAAEAADDLIDNLIEYVWSILADARNEKLGLDRGVVSSRWINTIKKDTVLELGDLVVKTAQIQYTCSVMESVLGATPTTPDPAIFNSTVQVGDEENAGVLVENSL